MVPSLEDDDVLAFDQVHEPVFVVNPAGPASLKDVAQLLGLADARERISGDVLELRIGTRETVSRLAGTSELVTNSPIGSRAVYALERHTRTP